jgi:hypothetical protein
VRRPSALRSGGLLVVEDIDISGRFADPPSPALDRADALYIESVRHRGGDSFIGRRLGGLLEAARFEAVETALVQSYARLGDTKQTAALTFHAISENLIADGHATSSEIAALGAEIDAFTARTDTTISVPRIFQAWGVRA